ncbi:DUF6923 family protein, partial [Phytoactinopolyspora limicola]|uniref:DUF7927 domain-containing protein n=1 Tax=Phytoactinopolyspora limicola TaxID=2715536 RepID=UPI00140A8B21
MTTPTRGRRRPRRGRLRDVLAFIGRRTRHNHSTTTNAESYAPARRVAALAVLTALLVAGLPTAGVMATTALDQEGAESEATQLLGEADASTQEDTAEQDTSDDVAVDDAVNDDAVNDDADTHDEAADEDTSGEKAATENSRDGPGPADGAADRVQQDATDESVEDEGDDSGPVAPMSSSPGTSGVLTTTFFAYVAAGETLDVAFTKAPGGIVGGATVELEGPGFPAETCEIPADGATPCEWQGASGEPGIWRIHIDSHVVNSAFFWEINVMSGATAVDGRVWSEHYRMRQGATSTHDLDLDLWFQTDTGYLYEATYHGYNGVNSDIYADATGVAYADTCASAYESWTSDGPHSDPNLWVPSAGDCGDLYKIFFEQPAADLPETATRWDGATDWIVPPTTTPLITDVTFSQDGPGSRAGEIEYAVDNFTGQLSVEIDTNGDGTYDLVLPGFAEDGGGSVTWDGLDGSGIQVSPFQELPVRVSIERTGEIHFANWDVEIRDGIEVTRLNGPGAGDQTLYWNDTNLRVQDRACVTPQLDGRAGVNSSGGVHGWPCRDNANDGIGGSWGDQRWIDDWTYVPVDVAEEIVVPADVQEPWVCSPDGLLFQYPGAEPPTQVQFVDLLTGDVDVAEVVIEGRSVNAAAYNVVDDFVYGWDNELVGDGPDRTGVVRIGADGSSATLGVPDHPELNAEDSFPVGDVDNNGHYWVSNAVGSAAHARWYQIDLNPGDTFMEVLNWGTVQGGEMSGIWSNSGDWAWVPGGGDNLWRVLRNTETSNWRLWRFDMATGLHHDAGPLSQLNAEGVTTFGAAFADEEFLYVSSNISGNIYRIDIQDVTASLFVEDGPPSGNNDGARCAIAPIYTDYGDAPDSYRTLLDSDGPRHGLRDYDPDTNTTSLMLGENVSHETDGQPSDEADLDTFDDGVADGIVLVPGEPVTVDVVVTNNTDEPATLAGWVDLGGTGTFDAGDRSDVVTVAANTSDTFTLTFGEATTESDTYARFRLYGGEVDDPSPVGAARSGEVEDYLVQFVALDVEKTSDATADSRPGDTVTYTVTLTNSGTSDYSADNPARVRDDLSGVLDDAAFDEGSLSADRPGTLEFDDPIVSWEGALDAGDTVTITYQVTLTGDGDGVVRNVAFVPDCDPADPDCEPVTPECDPPDENGRDPQTGLPCAENEFELPRLEIEKTADQADLPAVGETVTYTVTATNVGPGHYTADAPAVVTDDLSDVLDDATFDEGSLNANQPGTLEFDDPIVSWEGALDAGASVTITYTVTYTGEGDHVLLNLACVPEEQTAPDTEPCDSVRIPAAFVVESKSVEASEDPVQAGTVLTYTLTFENVGQAPGTVDTVDDLTHVLDDGDVTAGPDVSDPALSLEGLDANRFHITGTLDAGQTVTVTYEVTLRPDGERGDNRALN